MPFPTEFLVDTANDLRVRFYEGLLQSLEKYVRSGTIRDKENVVSKLSSLVKEIKYSYLEPSEIISTYGEKVDELASALDQIPVSSDAVRRFVRFVVEELRDFPRKFSRSIQEPFQVFRYAIVDVVGVSKHPTLQNLRVTRVRDQNGNVYTVVTNITNVKEGMRAAVVFLPPRAFEGVWSEAMFIKVGIKGPEDLSVKELRELNAHYYRIISF